MDIRIIRILGGKILKSEKLIFFFFFSYIFVDTILLIEFIYL